ncbi:MAG: PDDEXK nuclease domain-containing protein [Paludibacteraceae bacterium]|nr:PDDEXK nuclease domain-containing protein [Paludibacteraceae bacterium]
MIEIVEHSNNAEMIAEDHLYQDVCSIIEQGRESAYNAINKKMIETYWQIGKRIVEEEQHGKERANYGERVLENLSSRLTLRYGKGFSVRYLAYFRSFYLSVNDVQILQTRLQNLTWSHIQRTLRVDDVVAVRWYLETASQEMWSVRMLDRNIATQYYERHFQQPQLPSKEEHVDKLELLKSPIVAEFLGFKSDESYSEEKLESSIISHLQEFLMELGRGFAFVGRQQLVRTDTQDYFIDLVFYNVVLKCYVLIDLKIGTITHQDVGQMDMYVRMYDEIKRTEGDNPTIGIVLCSETSKDIARYSILKGNEQLFAAKYKTYLPTEDQLRQEIERQKDLFRLQQKNN